ncbi:MAG: leucine-rich repeat-containing protein kinase family protein [Shewanella sp.]
MQTLAQLTAGQLQGVRRLQLVEGLTAFPPQIFDLADTLEILDLSNNQLSELPEDLYRLTQLKVLFASNNRFEKLPEALGRCAKLEMIGFKSNRIKTVPADALPPQTRWLILTDNCIEALPDKIGTLARLQKLALAGNRLSTLPVTMAQCQHLELVRLAANRLSELPLWLFELPKLSWLAFAGNPLTESPQASPRALNRDAAEGMNTNVNHGAACVNARQSTPSLPSVPKVSLDSVKLGEKCGEGASGIIYQGEWLDESMVAQTGAKPIAVKLFKGEVTSDGYPADELACCLASGEHPNLIKVIAHIQQGSHSGLVMALIPQSFKNLGLPPSLVSCTRDTFSPDTALDSKDLTKIILQLADVMAHLHRQQISHGDVYAHNMMVNQQMDVLFGDFGAASDLRHLSSSERLGIEKLEVRALGCVIDDLLPFVTPSSHPAQVRRLREIRDCCLSANVAARPGFDEVKSALLA